MALWLYKFRRYGGEHDCNNPLSYVVLQRLVLWTQTLLRIKLYNQGSSCIRIIQTCLEGPIKLLFSNDSRKS